MARRGRRAVGAAEVPLHRVTALLRLFRYAAPYRLRFIAAIAAMLVYAAASAGLALSDQAHPRQRAAARPEAASGHHGDHRLLLVKGLGAYFSAYLMVDIGQRVVRDLRSQLHRHILEQSAGFFARRTTGQLLSRVTNDVGQVQHAVSETIGDLLQESLALIGYAVLLFYLDPALALVCITGAPLIVYPLAQLGRRLRKTTRRSQEAARASLAHRDRGVHRSPHRQGIWRRASRGQTVRGRHRAPVPDQHERHPHRVDPAAADGTARRRRDCGCAVVRQPRDCTATG